MRYLIIPHKHSAECQYPFLTDWYDYENNWDGDHYSMVIDLVAESYATDGKTFRELEEDHL